MADDQKVVPVKLDILERILIINTVSEHFMGEKKGNVANTILVKKIADVLKADEANDSIESAKWKHDRNVVEFQKLMNDYLRGTIGAPPSEKPVLLNADLRGAEQEFQLKPKIYTSIQDALKEKKDFKPQDVETAYSVCKKFELVKDDPTL